MKRLLLAVLLLAAPVLAQDKPDSAKPPEPPRVQKLFILKYADPRSVQGLIRTFGANAEPNEEMRDASTVTPPSSTSRQVAKPNPAWAGPCPKSSTAW